MGAGVGSSWGLPGGGRGLSPLSVPSPAVPWVTRVQTKVYCLESGQLDPTPIVRRVINFEMQT